MADQTLSALVGKIALVDADLLYIKDSALSGVGASKKVTFGNLRISLGGINVVLDLSPQLGADLDVNDFAIIAGPNGNIALTPSGLGHVAITGPANLTHTASFATNHGWELLIDAAGFADTRALSVEYVTGAIPVGSLGGVASVTIDRIGSVGGSIAGFSVTTLSQGSANVVGLGVSSLVDPILQLAGILDDAASILVKAVDQLIPLSQGGAGNITMFVADNDTVTIGADAKFQELEFVIDTPATNPGVIPAFEFSTGIGTWASFAPFDGTNGFRSSGSVVWLITEIPGWLAGLAGEFLIRITRTANPAITQPVVDLVQLNGALTFSWDKNGLVTINQLITVAGDVDGRDVAVDGTKLDTIASGATVNSSDATLLNRINHSGSQSLATISDSGSMAAQDANAVAITGGTVDGVVILASLGSAALPPYSFLGDPNTGMFSSGGDTLNFATAGLERIRINSLGRIVISASADGRVPIPVSHFSFTPIFSINGESGALAAIAVTVADSDVNVPATWLTSRARGTLAVPLIVADNDAVGDFLFGVYDGVDYLNSAARIRAEIDGSPGVNDTPGALVFSTTRAGSQSPTESMRLNALGNMEVQSGTIALPGLAFSGDLDTGIVLLGANNLGISVGGVKQIDINVANVTINRPRHVKDFTATVTVALGELCFVDGAGGMTLADADAETTADTLLAIALEAITATNSGSFLLYGERTTTGLTAGAPQYVSTTAGEITETKPVGTGDIVRRVGTALSTTLLWFDGSQVFIEVV